MIIYNDVLQFPIRRLLTNRFTFIILIVGSFLTLS